jgi:hypothetical protein
MTRRFADSDRWKAIRKLSASLKTLYDYAWDMADAAGVYEVDEDYLFIDLGERYTEKDFEKIPYNLEKIAPGKFLFKNFIEVQYTEIKEGYNPHKPAKRDLEKHGLILNEKKNQACRKLGSKLEEEGEDKEEGKEEDEKGGVGDFAEVEIFPEPELEVCPTFDQFWDEYDKKRGDKDKLKKKWQKLRQEERERIMEFIPNYKVAQPDKQFRKDPDTFFNTKGWNDELIFKNNGIQQTNNSDKRAAFGKYFAGKA